MKVNLEYSSDGIRWAEKTWITAAKYNGERYALFLGNLVLSFYWNRTEADDARDSIDQQLYILGHLARLFGFGPGVVHIRHINKNIEVMEV